MNLFKRTVFETESYRNPPSICARNFTILTTLLRLHVANNKFFFKRSKKSL